MIRNSNFHSLRIGFVPLLDAAPLIAAVELGITARLGLRVKLVRQLGWASLRDHLLFGDLDAAHAPAGLMLAINAGLSPVPTQCLTGFIFNVQGNAITLSTRLHQEGIRDVQDLADYARHKKIGAQLTFAVVSRYSSHPHLLRHWLNTGGIKLGQDARLVILPPSQMQRCLEAGHIDGFCVGEPWNSVSLQAGAGWIAAHGASLAPSHPEKVLMVQRSFAQQHAEQHHALITALAEAAAWCADTKHAAQLASLLHRTAFPFLQSSLIEQSLLSHDAPVFLGADLHRPVPEKASWLIDEMLRHGLLPKAVAGASLHEAFRADIYERALSPRTATPALAA